MTLTPEEQDEALEGLYRLVPDIPGCKGLCHNSCTSIEMSARERDRLAENGIVLTPHDVAQRKLTETGTPHRCEALDADNRCTIYDKRPMICRLFGTTQVHVGEGFGFLNCEFGCAPERPLTENEALELLDGSMKIGGFPKVWLAERGLA